MKTSLILFVFVFSVLAASCCHHKKTCKQQENNSSTGTTPEDKTDTAAYLNFVAYYYHTTEATYEEVSIKNGKLTYTYFKDEKGDCSQWVQQKPCWTMNDLKTKEIDLTKPDVDSLAQKIEKYGFGKLDTVIGNTAETDRYYTFDLSFKISSINKKVLFKSLPGGVTMPDAFRKSRDELMKVVRKKLGFN